MKLLNLKTVVLAVGMTALFGCFNNDDDNNSIQPSTTSYQVKMVNLTAAQPLSPLSVVLQSEGTQWMIGEPVSTGIEVLAEGGDNSEWFAQEEVIRSASGSGPIMPGNSATVEIISNSAAPMLSLASMLVNTNDAFAGATGIDLSTITSDAPMTMYLPALDAGTEANSEAAGTIPGPADGGTGYVSTRDDVNYLAYHSGVLSDAELPSSVLKAMHRFDNPVVKVTISRVN